MHMRAFSIVSLIVALALAGCGGGGGASAISGNIPGGNSPQTDSMAANDLFDIDGSDLLNELENDAGFTATSSVGRTPSSAGEQSPQIVNGTFTFQQTGGTASVARPGTAVQKAIGFMTTFRDASGYCECSNDNKALPAPYATTITNPSWMGGATYKTVSSTTTLGIAINGNAKIDSSDHGGTYTGHIVPANPGGSTTFAIGNNTIYLPRQSPAAITFAGNALANCPAGSAYVSWTPVAGAVEYFVAFMTHLNNDPKKNPGFNTVGFVVTDRSHTCVPGSEFYSKATYQILLIGADATYIGIYDSQGKVQAPKLPTQLDFTVSQLLTFTTP